MNNLSSPFALIKKSFTLFFDRNNMVYFLKIFSMPFVLGVVSFILSYYAAMQGFTPDQYLDGVLSGNIFLILYVIVWSLISMVLGLWGQVASYLAIIRVVDLGDLSFKDTYVNAWKYILSFFGLNLLVGLIIFGGLILLIIPAILFGIWYCFAAWAFLGRGLGVVESLKFSRRIVLGRFWKVLGRVFIFIVFGILIQVLFSLIPNNYGTVLAIIFGGLSLLPYYLLYRELSQQPDSI